MYCVKCGVRLADTEKVCPLCETPVFFPEERPDADPLFPKGKAPKGRANTFFVMLSITLFCLLSMLTVLLTDLRSGGGIGWSAFVMGAIFTVYICFILPFWFKKPNPVIFTPCGFASVAAYLMLISAVTAGSWFFSFALPVVVGITLIVTAVVTLTRYLHRGKLYVFGGASLALGLYMPIIELHSVHTFEGVRFVAWSFYPLIALALLGGWLIFVASYRPAREALERIFFI